MWLSTLETILLGKRLTNEIPYQRWVCHNQEFLLFSEIKTWAKIEIYIPSKPLVTFEGKWMKISFRITTISWTHTFEIFTTDEEKIYQTEKKTPLQTVQFIQDLNKFLNRPNKLVSACSCASCSFCCLCSSFIFFLSASFSFIASFFSW